MKIALVSPYDFAYPGGVTNHIFNLDRQFTRMGHDVRIIAPASRAVPYMGEGFIPIGTPRSIPTSGSIARITISLRLAGAIKEVLNREQFDIIHLHEPFMPMLCSAVLRFSNTVNVGTFHACHGSPGYEFGWPFTTIMLKRRARKLHGMIAVSEPALDFAREYVPGDYEIIPNGINLSQYHGHIEPVHEFCDGKLNILFVGRLEKRKGLIYLLKAYRQVKREIPDSRLIVVGPGARLRHKYERMVRNCDLKDVAFVGFVSGDELPRYYQTAHVFCAPATGRESFGIVLLEAMAMGKPVVASNIAGYASLVTHGQEGWLVSPKDDGELASALTFLLRNEPLRLRLGQNGRLKAKDYAWEKVSRRVFDYYLSVLDRVSGKEHSPQVEALV